MQPSAPARRPSAGARRAGGHQPPEWGTVRASRADREYAEEVLDLTKWVLQDPAYVARLERHYRMVKDATAKPKAREKWWKRKKKRR